MLKETKIRHRIHEHFTEKHLIELDKIRRSGNYSNNNQKIDDALMVMKDIGVVFIASGTNRFSILIDNYIYKIAMDSFGIRDNWTEFNYSQELQPYVTKTYETNGLIAVAEYVNLFTKEEFIDSRDNINGILAVLAENYLFCDISTSLKNLCNFGYRASGDIVILDFGYIYPIDRKIMHCKSCGGNLIWNRNYTELLCENCKRPHDPIEIRDRMKKRETDFHRLEERFGKGPLVLNL